MTSRFDERAKQRVEELIKLGEEVDATVRDIGGPRAVGPDFALYVRWTTSSLTFFEAALGEDSEHYRAFADILSTPGPPVAKVASLFGVLEAARDDIQSGWVGRRDLLLTADAFGSLLEQADYLLEQGYKDPAAMLAGAVLESTLRKMCEVRGISTDRSDKIGTLNDKLAKQHKPPAYGSMDHKLIIGWADLRNNADHGHFQQYKPEDVRNMTRWVREFAARHLA
jgi:hypothetical protein